MKKISILLFLFSLAFTAFGKITLPSLISNNMVLQQKSNAKIWGWAEPNQLIHIKTTWSRETFSTQSDNSGNWSINVKTPGHSTGERMTILSGRGDEKIEISNIMIGEVWLASGQSNMEFEMMPNQTNTWMTGAYNWEEEVKDANYPEIHLFKVEPKWEHNTPLENCNGEWVVCSPEVAKRYSAIAFLFARELHTTLKMPVGVIQCAFGGTHGESWTRMELMESDTLYNKCLEKYALDKDVCKKYPHKYPSSIWNGMVNPIVGYTIKGNIWYQAESNAWRAWDYATVFENLVNDWRKLWGQKRLPFYYMQVAPFETMPAEIREQQAFVWENKRLKDIGMATAIDVGDSLDIHPKNKVVPAHRLAVWALAKEYDVDVECCGPLFDSFKFKDGRVIISFKYDKGLYIKGNGNAQYLYITDADGKRYRANSTIQKSRLVVWHPNVTNPQLIEYCSEDYCKGDIYNGSGLPAYPFKIKIGEK